MSKPPRESQPAEDRTNAETHAFVVGDMLRSLHKYSLENWSSREEALWREYVEICWNTELKLLTSGGLPPEKAERLVQRAWASRDPKSGELGVKRRPADDTSAYVPVILVFRNGGFEIHHVIRSYLDYHPLLAIPGREPLTDRDHRAGILQILDEVDAIEEDLGLGYLGLAHSDLVVPDDGGKCRRTVDCGTAAHQLRCLLNPEFRGNETEEDLEWLDLGKSGKRFWQLLDTAFLLGEAMERRRLLDERGAEEATLRMAMTPPGKLGRLNVAIARMIDDYILEKKSLPTPSELLTWLGGERPVNNAEPLEVDHPLWTDPMKNVSWERFQDLVKQTKKKLNR